MCTSAHSEACNDFGSESLSSCAGEDASEAHQNDAMWYHDFASGTTTRMLSTPYGSETTSPYWYPNINEHAYLMAVVQV